MPSITHEAPIELIRKCPEMALEMLRAASGLTLKDARTVRLGITDASKVVPATHLVDCVVIAEDESGNPVLAIVIESQSRDPHTKKYSWPSYVTSIRAKIKCDAVLLVICRDPAEAARCRKTIKTGHPGFDLTPIVSDPTSPLSSGDPKCGPYLTLYAGYLGAIDLETDDGQNAVLEAAQKVPEDDRKSCVTLIMAVASEAARQAMEEKMTTTAYRNEFIESFYERGLAEGEAKGLAEGEARGHGEDLLKLLDVRGVHVTAENREQVTSCTDLAQLRTWFSRAITATSAAEVFDPEMRATAA